MNCDKNSLLLYAVTDRAWLQTGETLLGRVRDAIEGGATFVQLREKDLDPAAFLAEGREIGALCREMGVPFVVDDDVDPFDMSDVLWAMTTRYQGNLDTVFLPGVRGHVLDPTQSPLYDARIPARGVGCKAIFDCTVPFDQKERFQRAPFMEVDPGKFLI